MLPDPYALLERLFPITRSLTGPGTRESFAILAEVAGEMDLHTFRSGERVFDWTVPDEWTIRDAWIKGPDGRKVVDLADSNLHLVGYSAPVHDRLPLAQLQEHLFSLPDQPDAIPYRTSYYERRWGFCLTQRQRDGLSDGEYEVFVDADLDPGRLQVGEVTIAGETDEEVLFSTYVCHPSLANNELSGPVVAAYLARALRDRAGAHRYTYRFLFLPETIGAIAYLSRFGERLRERLAAGYVVTCCGDPGGFTYKRSRRGDTLADRAAEHVLAHAGRPYRIVDFFPGGSDERQYCSPGFDLPVGSLMRSMYGTYPEYHTSLDDLSFVTPAALEETLELYGLVVDTLEANETLTTTVPYCEPHLSSRGLYPTVGSQVNRPGSELDMMWLLNLCDGSSDLLAAAVRAQRPLWRLRPVADRLIEAGLLAPARRLAPFAPPERTTADRTRELQSASA